MIKKVRTRLKLPLLSQRKTSRGLTELRRENNTKGTKLQRGEKKDIHIYQKLRRNTICTLRKATASSFRVKFAAAAVERGMPFRK
jgi:hypothetical protein